MPLARWTSARLLLGLLVTGGAATVACAQIVAPPSARAASDLKLTDDVLARLDADDIETRERTTLALATASGLRVKDIEDALSKSSLSPEQRRRLLRVGAVLFTREPRAAMGVQFTWGNDGRQPTIESPRKGFDSERVLRPGDVIQALDGRRVRSQGEVRAAIVARDPGDTMTLSILRDGVPAEVQLKLGSFSDLQAGMLDDAMIQTAWRIRLLRLSGNEPAVLDPGMTEEAWAESQRRQAGANAPPSELTHDPITGDLIRSVLPRPPAGSLSMGGQTRVNESNPRYRTVAGGTGRIRVLGNRGNGPIIIEPQPDQGRVRLEQIDLLSAQLALIRQQMDALRPVAEDPNAPAEARQDANARLVLLQQREAQFVEMITQLEDLNRAVP